MTVGFVASCFDLMHAGHLIMLEDAKRMCDYLIVALHTDPSIERPTKNRPVESTFERYTRLKSCKYIDEIIPYDTERDLMNILRTKKIDIRIIGSDYKGMKFTGSDLTIPVYYHKREHDLSSSELRARINKSADA